MPPAALLRILDAMLNRAGEGLRIVEDYVRFALDDPFLTREVKSLRHDLAAASATISAADRHAARDTARDVGTNITTLGEQNRSDLWAVCQANLKRSEESLRGLEEFGKTCDGEFAQRIEALRYRLYTLEKAIDVGRTSRERLEGVRLCLLAGGQESASEFERFVAQMVEAGVGMIQLRDKRLDDRELLARARLLVSLTRHQSPAPPGVENAVVGNARKSPAEPGAERVAPGSTLAIINDRADIAATVQADGVHLGQDDLSVKDARTIVGTRMLVGVSTHNIDQARAAVRDGANYLGAGPTFPSQTKSFERFAGLAYLREIAGEIRLPTFAIGGITPQNLSDVLATGMTRVAVGSAITAADQPASAASDLLSMLASAEQSPRPPAATS